MRYLSNCLIDYGEICTAMHIRPPNLMVDQNLKISNSKMAFG